MNRSKKTEGERRRGWQRMRWFNSIADSMELNLSTGQEVMEDREAWRAAVHAVTKIRKHSAAERQQQESGQEGGSEAGTQNSIGRA